MRSRAFDTLNQQRHAKFPPMESSATGNYAEHPSVGKVFTALADPTRRSLLAALAHGPATVSELATHHRVGLPAISKHLTVLERAGLIQREKRAQWRRCRLERQGFDALNAWMTYYTALWTGSMDRLDDFLQNGDGEDE